MRGTGPRRRVPQSRRRRWQERKLAMGAAPLLLLAITIKVWINNPKGH
ncbi:hypothetical protein ABT126_13830 [Streptomyces sp. NPDC002012]